MILYIILYNIFKKLELFNLQIILYKHITTEMFIVYKKQHTPEQDLPIEDRFYVVTPDLKKWIDLNPYFKYGNCNVCDHNRVLIYDGVYMLDPYIGHRFQLNQK